jgi:protein involved in polysaccharide export with SLBB domain
MNRPESGPFRSIRTFILLSLLLLPAGSAAGQAPPTLDRRPQATRAQLDSTLAEIDKIIASPAYSDELKRQKQMEAAVIRERLLEGDFQVGDQLNISLSVPIQPNGQPLNNVVFTVGPNQMLQLPDIPEIPLRGVLRSEIKDYLTERLQRLFKDQTVQVVPTIRLTILGGIPQPGFYQLPADMPLPDAIMKAGGPTQNSELEHTVIKRGQEELWGEEEVAAAITAGTTLDQLNLRAGDELVVGQKSNTNWFQTIRTYALIPGLILSLAALGRLFGII